MGLNLFGGPSNDENQGLGSAYQPPSSGGLNLFGDDGSSVFSSPSAQVPVSQLPGALPAMGREDLKPSFTPFEDIAYQALSSSTGYAPQVAEALGLVPKGYYEQKMSSARDAMLGWIPGLAEEAQNLTGINVPGVEKGDRQKEMERIRDNYIAVSAQPLSKVEQAAPILRDVSTSPYTEFGVQISPGLVSGASLSSLAAKELPVAMKAVGAGVASVAEGLIQGVGNTAGMDWGQERLKQLGIAGGLAAAGGYLGYKGVTRELAGAASPKKIIPTEGDPAIALRAAAYDKTAQQIERLRSQVVDEKIQGDAQKAASIALNDISTLRDQVELKAKAASVVAHDTGLQRILLEQARGATEQLAGEDKGVVSAVNSQLDDTLPHKALNVVDPGPPIWVDGKIVGTTANSPNFGKAAGTHYGAFDEPWMVGVEKTQIDKKSFAELVESSGKSLAPVGEYQRAVLSGEYGSPKIYEVDTKNSGIGPLRFLEMVNKKNGKSTLFSLRNDQAPTLAAEEAVLTGDPSTLHAHGELSALDATESVNAADLAVRDAMSTEMYGNINAQKLHNTATQVDQMLRNAAQDETGWVNPFIAMSSEDLAKAERGLIEREQRARLDLDQANKILDALPQRDAVNLRDASAAIAMLRQAGFKAAQYLGSPDLFEVADRQYRMERILQSPSIPDPELGFRTPERAYSEYLDLNKKILDKVSFTARKRFEIEYRKGNPLAPSVEEFVIEQRNNAAMKLDKKVQEVLAVNRDKSPAEVIRAMDNFAKSEAKRNKIRRNKLEFRGYTDEQQKSMMQDASEWLSPYFADGKKPHLPIDDLLAIANKAKVERAPLGVFDVLQKEIARRMEGIPPIDVPSRRGVMSAEEGNPEILDQAVAKSLQDEQSRLAAKVLGGPDLKGEQGPVARALGKIENFIRTQSQPYGNVQLTEGNIGGGMLGHYLSTEDMVGLHQSPQARRNIRAALNSVMQESKTVKSLLMHNMGAAMRDVVTVAKDYSKRLKATTGQSMTTHDVLSLMGDYYRAGISGDFPDPVVRDALKNRVATSIDSLSKMLLKNVSDPELASTIKDHMGWYLFQDYSSLRDPTSVYKPVDRSNPAYVRFFERTKKGELDGMKEEAYTLFRQKVLEGNPTLSDSEVEHLVSKMVDEKVHAKIESMIKNHMVSEQMRSGAKKVLPTVREKYFEHRVLTDKDFIEIMGGTKNIAASMYATVDEIAHDIAADNLRRGIYDILKGHQMITESPVGPNTVKIDKESLRIVESEEDVKGGVLYAHPIVADILGGMTSATQAASPLSKTLGLIKVGYVGSLGWFMRNVWGIPQMAALASGGGLLRINPIKTLVAAAQTARELTAPGSAGIKAVEGVQGKLMRSLGMLTQNEVRDMAEMMVKHGLDSGGALVEDAIQGASAALKGSKPEKFGSMKSKLFGWMRRPDLVAKLMAFHANAKELQWKEGVSSLSSEQMKQVAERTKKLVQTPETTPAGVSNLSRGAAIIPFGGFQSFAYQMQRNMAYAWKFAFDDLGHGLKLMTAGEGAKGGRYVTAGTGRIVSSALMAYYMWNKLTNTLSAHPDKEDSFRHFLPEGQRDSRIIINDIKRENGKVSVSYINTGRLNLYDNTMQIIESVARNMKNNSPQNIPSEIMGVMARQIFAPGIMAKNLALVANLNLTDDWVSTDTSHMKLSWKNARKAGEAFLPTLARYPVDVLERYAARSEKAKAAALKNPELRKAEMQRVDEMYDDELHRLWAKTVDQATGISFQKSDANQLVLSRFKEDWNKTAMGWIQGATRDYKGLKMDQNSRAQFFRTYEPMWDKTWNALQDSVNSAVGMQYTNKELTSLLSPEKGQSVPFSKKIVDKLVSRKHLSLKEYFDIVGADPEEDYWK